MSIEQGFFEFAKKHFYSVEVWSGISVLDLETLEEFISHFQISSGDEEDAAVNILPTGTRTNGSGEFYTWPAYSARSAKIIVKELGDSEAVAIKFGEDGIEDHAWVEDENGVVYVIDRNFNIIKLKNK
jgi:hypothetical protein